MQTMAVLQQIWLSEIIGCMLLMCQNTTMRVYGAWITTNFVLCSKTYSSYGYVLQSSVSSWQAARGTHICEMGLLLVLGGTKFIQGNTNGENCI